MNSDTNYIGCLIIKKVLNKLLFFKEMIKFTIKLYVSIELEIWGKIKNKKELIYFEKRNILRKILFQEYLYIVTQKNKDKVIESLSNSITENNWGIIHETDSIILSDFSHNTIIMDFYSKQDLSVKKNFLNELLIKKIISDFEIIID